MFQPIKLSNKCKSKGRFHSAKDPQLDEILENLAGGDPRRAEIAMNRGRTFSIQLGVCVGNSANIFWQDGPPAAEQKCGIRRATAVPIRQKPAR